MIVTFVCTGNTCRSPMGEAILQNLADKWGWDMRVFSAGLYASIGSPVSENAREVLRYVFGIRNFFHSARPMTQDLFDSSDLVIGMTEGHARVLTERFGVYDKIVSMPVDVGDPWGGDLAAYEICAQRIVEGIKILKDRGLIHA